MDSLRDKLALIKKHQLESYRSNYQALERSSQKDSSNIKTGKLIEDEIKLLEDC